MAPLCGPKCSESKTCTHYVWRNWNNGLCFLKYGKVSKTDAVVTNETTTICGIVANDEQALSNSSVAWAGNDWAYACDFHGNNISDALVSAASCGPTCAQTPQCTHFSWTQVSYGTCRMKSGTVSKNDAFSTFDPNMLCGIPSDSEQAFPNSSVVWDGNNWAYACDFHGNDFSIVLVSGALCGPTCTQTPKCTHFSWTQVSYGTCRMKNGTVSKNDAFSTNDATMLCGIITGNEQAVTNSSVVWIGNNWAYACDFSGKDLSNALVLSASCRPTCALTPKCTHFTWNQVNNGTCWMKSGTVSKSDAFATFDPNMICGILNESEQAVTNSSVIWNGNNWAYACDFHENDLSNALVPAASCGPTCAETPECTHFTWNLVNNGTCWMKSGTVSKNDAFSTNDATMLCGIITGNEQAVTNSSVVWNGKNWAYACDFHGNDLSNVLAPAALCGPTCALTPKCTHFTWNQVNNGTCWMKSGTVSKSDAFATFDPNMICGIQNESEQAVTNSSVVWNGNNWAYACDFHGNDLSNALVPAASCGPTCAETPECTHFTWNLVNNGTCWMKSGTVSKNDAFSTNDTTMVCGILSSK